MKNKVTGLPNKTGFMTFADLAMDLINLPPEGGFNVDEMSLRLKMRAKLESANGTIKLDAAEIVKLQELAPKHPWGILHVDILDFCNKVKELK